MSRSHPKTPEGYVKAALLEYLAVKRIYALRLNSGVQVLISDSGKRRSIQMAPAGTSDILAAPKIHGIPVFLWIEVKGPKGRLEDSQKLFAAERMEDGHFFIVARSIEDLEQWLQQHQ